MASADNERDREMDLQALLESVHGKDEVAKRHDVLEDAVRTLEATHRQAALAIRTFERTGRGPAEATPAALQAWPNERVASGAQTPQTPERVAPAASPPSAREEATQTYVRVAPVPFEQEVTAPEATPAGAQVRAASVYSGQGADVSLRQGTQTHIVHRPKK